MKPNIAERIAEIRKMLAAATPGPWFYDETDDGHVIRMGEAIESPYNHDSHLAIEYDHGCYYDEDEDESEAGNKQALEAEANAQLIARAPVTISALCDEVERQAEEIKTLRHELYIRQKGGPLAKELSEEVERLRKALEFYAKEENYHNRQYGVAMYESPAIEIDMGLRAREALKEGE